MDIHIPGGFDVCDLGYDGFFGFGKGIDLYAIGCQNTAGNGVVLLCFFVVQRPLFLYQGRQRMCRGFVEMAGVFRAILHDEHTVVVLHDDDVFFL